MKISNLEAALLALWSRRHLIGGPDWVAELPEPIRQFQFHPVRKWPFDFAWPAYRVAVECDGGIYAGLKSHSGGAAIHKDHEKRNAAAELGWRVLVFTSTHLVRESLRTIQQVANLLRQGPVADIQEQLPLF